MTKRTELFISFTHQLEDKAKLWRIEALFESLKIIQENINNTYNLVNTKYEKLRTPKGTFKDKDEAHRLESVMDKLLRARESFRSSQPLIHQYFEGCRHYCGHVAHAIENIRDETLEPPSSFFGEQQQQNVSNQVSLHNKTQTAWTALSTHHSRLSAEALIHMLEKTMWTLFDDDESSDLIYNLTISNTKVKAGIDENSMAAEQRSRTDLHPDSSNHKTEWVSIRKTLRLLRRTVPSIILLCGFGKMVRKIFTTDITQPKSGLIKTLMKWGVVPSFLTYIAFYMLNSASAISFLLTVKVRFTKATGKLRVLDKSHQEELKALNNIKTHLKKSVEVADSNMRLAEEIQSLIKEFNEAQLRLNLRYDASFRSNLVSVYGRDRESHDRPFDSESEDVQKIRDASDETQYAYNGLCYDFSQYSSLIAK
eukprot:gb/GECH01002485.1/.p1 GENE.gb/GECH01002485.1/~~gb/GECH01002485.1/.p1  ORF type:complete len:424 (+),score=89.27 gb/GECH01002485.1/:1-1272(+)